MLDQCILTDRLSHLAAKRVIKERELNDSSIPGLASIQSKVHHLVITAISKILNQPEDYGICESCGEEIPLSRLLSVPETPFCLPCAQKEETKNGRR